MTPIHEGDRSLSEIIKSLGEDLGRLMTAEIALLKTEMRENVAKLGTGAGLFGGAGIAALFALEFLLIALLLGLIAAGLPAWVSAVLIALLMGAVAGVLALRGKKSVASASVLPEEAMEQLKADAAAIKSDLQRVARK